MTFQANPLGRMVNNYLMKAALPLAGWFIAEYLLRNAALTNLALNMVTVVLMLVTPYIIWRMLRRLRIEVLSNMMLGIQAWMFGVQLVFFAGLIEALFIYVFNEFISPNNLADTIHGTITTFQTMLDQLKAANAYSWAWPMLEDTLQQLQSTPVPTAIDTAISALSNEIMSAMLYMIPLSFGLRRKPDMN